MHRRCLSPSWSAPLLAVMMMACVGACESTAVAPPPAASTTTPASTSPVVPSASIAPHQAKPRAVFALTFNGALPRDVLVMEGVPRDLARVATRAAQDPRRWREIVITTSAGERRVVLFGERFSKGHQVRLTLDAQQRIVLGVFPEGGAEPAEQVDDVRSIDLLYDAPSNGPLTVRFANDDKKLELALLATLPPVAKGPDGENRGVRLRDVLHALSPKATIGSVTVAGRDKRTFCAAELHDPAVEVLVRSNKRGRLSVEVWLAADASGPSTRLRDLEDLSVASKPCPRAASSTPSKE